MSGVTAIKPEVAVYSAEMHDIARHPNLYLVETPHLAERVDQLPVFEYSQARAKRFIGQVAMEDVYIDPCEDEAPNTSLLEAIYRANTGDEEAKASVQMNAHIAVVEAMIKSGHITRVPMKLNEHGNWLQHGQAMLHVHANALRTQIVKKHQGIKDRTEAETINGHAIEDLGRMGTLDDHYVFVPSLFPDDSEISYTIATEEAGFFGDTKTAAFQLTGKVGNEGHVESAFVAGVIEKDGSRHDIEVMRKIYMLAGFVAEKWLPLDFLKNPLVIHKSNLPYGIADMVQLYDELASEMVVAELFFGQDVEGQEYARYAEASKIREDGLQSVTDEVVRELLSRSHELTTPESAIELLAELVGPLGVKYAVTDHSIDPIVFGYEAAQLIHQARQYQ
ncbi:MAG: hypothetical protein QG628_115, partial [Patescibacteria group bacterium]|nr:hypothetical protein [Patescibacteria group bacterium]